MSETRVHNPRLVLAVVAATAFLATFNETFLNVALTPIMQTFSLTSATVQWVSTAYMLVAAIVVPVTSFLYRSIPTRALNVSAVAFLLVGTLIGGFAPNFGALIAARVIQAIGTGMLVPIGINLTLLVAPQGQLGSYMGVVSAVTLLGPAFGPIAGGVLLSVADWHALFFVFAALVFASLVLTALVIKDFAALSKPHLDAASVALVAVGLVGVLYAVSTAFSGALAITAGCACAGIAALAAFFVRQTRLEEPLLDLRPLGIPGFATSLLVVFVAFMAVFAMNIVLPLLMQGSLGFTAMGAALTLLGPCLLCCMFSPVAGKLFDRIGLRITLPAALAVMMVFLALLSAFGGSATSGVLALLYAPVLIGCAFSVGPAQSFALSRLTPDLHPHGTTMCYTAIQVAGCIGSSFYVGIMSAIEQSALAGGASQVAANASGFGATCAVAAVFALVGLVLALMVSRAETASRRTPVPAAIDPLFDRVMKHEAYSIPADSTAREALSAMVNYRTSGLPLVAADGTVVGFISDGDIMRALADDSSELLDTSFYYAHWLRRENLHESLEELNGVSALSLATKNVVSVERGRGLDEVCRTLSDLRIKKVPVTEGGHLVGSVSRADLLRFLVSDATA